MLGILFTLCGIWGYRTLRAMGNKNPIIGFFLGFFFNLVGVLICYLCFDEE